MKKAKSNKAVTKPQPVTGGSNAFSGKLGMLSWMLGISCVLITALLYLPSLHNEFVGLDDYVYVPTASATFSDIRAMFTSFMDGNYDPLTRLDLAIDFYLFKDVATGYHVASLLLHLLSTGLVFFFCWRLSKEVWVAAIVALLFGIHPMHVESVAWVTERKDQLYVVFYMAALCSYLLYRDSEKKSYLLLTGLFFLLSLLSKGQAVTLSVVLILIDLYRGELSRKTIIEKIPFLVLSLLFGVVAMIAQKSAGFSHGKEASVIYSLPERMLFVFYELTMYVSKLIAPLNLSAFYPYPQKTGGSFPMMVYLSPVIVLSLSALLIWKFRSNKWVLFGILFFLVTIAPVLQLVPVGSAIIADRYTYLSALGLFYVFAVFVVQLVKKMDQQAGKYAVVLALVVYLIFLSSTAYARTKVWQNAKSLWYDMKEGSPDNYAAYHSLGKLYVDEYQKSNSSDKESLLDSAFMYFTSSIRLQPNDADAYVDRSFIFDMRGKYDSVIADCNTALSYEPGHLKAYENRGTVYAKQGNFEEALKDFKKGLELHSPRAKELYVNIGYVYEITRSPDSALMMYNKALELDPTFEVALKNRERVLQNLGQKQ